MGIFELNEFKNSHNNVINNIDNPFTLSYPVNYIKSDNNNNNDSNNIYNTALALFYTHHNMCCYLRISTNIYNTKNDYIQLADRILKYSTKLNQKQLI